MPTREKRARLDEHGRLTDRKLAAPARDAITGRFRGGPTPAVRP